MAELAAPEHRGALVIRDRALTRIVETTALAVPGVARTGSQLTRLTGRDLPRAELSTGNGSVAVTLYLAVRWPTRLDTLGDDVRGRVAEELTRQTGLRVGEINVVVADAAPGQAGDLPGGDLVTGGETDADLAAAPRARTPRAQPAAVPAAIVAALGALGLAFVAARELLIDKGTVPGAPWVRNTVEWAARLHWSDWIIPGVVASLALGVVLAALALKPRPRTHLALRSEAGTVPVVFTRPRDLARASSAAARRVGGVRDVRTTVDRRHVTVVADGSGDAAELDTTVGAAVAPLLSLLDEDRALRVRVRT